MEPLLHRRRAAFSRHQVRAQGRRVGQRETKSVSLVFPQLPFGLAAEASGWCAVCSEEERRWLAEAVERHMAEDVVSRLREIALLMSTPLSVLEAQGITPDDIEGKDTVVDTC